MTPVVLLAPNDDGDLVTSQRGTVTAADHAIRRSRWRPTTAATSPLAGEALDADHLDHGYAMTVHREQGATCDRTHYLADGGGRELAYVAMSRARQHSTVHAVADDLDQAVDDITYDWSLDRHQQWITHTHQPDAEPAAIDRALDQANRDLAETRRILDHLAYQSPSTEPPAPDVGFGL